MARPIVGFVTETTTQIPPRPSYWPLAQHVMNCALIITSTFALGYHFAMYQMKSQNVLERIEQLETIVEPFRCPDPVENPPEPPTEVQNF
jgi:hypothetical protein